MRHIDRYLQTRENLQHILRYRRKKVMHYRSNVAVHESRVLALAQEIYPFALKQGIKLNKNLLETFAELHDDFELINHPVIQDYHLGIGDKALEERRAIHKLNGSYTFDRRGLNSRQTLIRYVSRVDLEAQLVEYLNIFDGFAEAIHEIAAGNSRFLDVPNVHRKKLFELGCKNSALRPLYNKNHPLFEIPVFDDTKDFKAKRTFHDNESLITPTGYAPYDFWKRTILLRGNLEAFESITVVKEYQHSPKKVAGLLEMAYN